MMTRIDVAVPQDGQGSYIGTQLQVARLQLEWKRLGRDERRLAALTARGEVDDDLEIDVMERSIATLESLLNFMADFVASVDGEPVDPATTEGRARARAALTQINKEQWDALLVAMKGPDEVPLSSATG